MNKILFPATGCDLNAALADRFGRAPYLIEFDIIQGTFIVERNTVDGEAEQGAGIQTAAKAVNAGADAVVTVNCGPKAFRVLQEAGIKVFLSPPVAVSDAIQALRAGSLREASGANVTGHW